MPSAVFSSLASAATLAADQQQRRAAIVHAGEGHTLSVAEADRRQRRIALAAIILSGGLFLASVPFATTPLVPIAAFIPAYEASLVILDLVTAVLLLGQFTHQRSAATLVIAAGYLFDAFMVVPHALSYPGLLAPGGWLGGGAQTTAWLYMFWHGGFPVFVIAYAVLRQHSVSFVQLRRHPVLLVIAGVGVLALLLTLIAIDAQSLLPAIMDGNRYTGAMKFVVGSVLVISLGAVFCLARSRPLPVLDLWLCVVMVAWTLDVALSAALNAQRFDLGFYAGRAYGLFAVTFVLMTILVENARLQGRLATATGQLAAYSNELDDRVQERTRELARANRRLAAILESSPVAIFMLDRQSRVMLWTASAERVFGYSEQEALGKLPPYLIDEHVANFGEKVADVVTDPAANGFFEARRRRKDGTVIDVSVRWARVNDEAGEMLGLMYAVADRTEIKKIEIQLQQAQKMEAVGNLTGGMAHDFNNLLGIVIGNLDLLLDSGLDDAELEEFAREAQEAAWRGADLTKRLLAFARKQPLQPERTDVNHLVGGITQLLKRTLGEDVKVSVELGDNIWDVVIDPAQLESSLINLANNARDAMPGGGDLIIATANRHLDEDYASEHIEVQPGDYALVEVSDSGTGMPPEVAARIFEPFYTTKEQGKGTGLGLSMVFGFIKQSGGHINVYSEVGIGTTFRLYLPRVLAKDEIAAQKNARNSVVGRGETILAVEDNPGLRRVLVRQLQELGYRVIEAENAQDASALLEREKIHLLLTDVVMPGGIGGGELARGAVERWPDLKVLLTSGFPENRIGNDPNLRNIRLLSKPYRREDLANTLREIMGTTG
jgi:PAS domain S-box-containing protein